MSDDWQGHERMRDHAWKYFQLHASQRLTSFNFYLIISAAAITGFITVIGANRFWLGMVLGALLVFLSFIFWQLDRRNRDLVSHSERALRLLESQFPVPSDQDSPLRILTLEEREAERQKAVRWPPWRVYLT